MPASSTAATEDTVPEPLLLTIGRAGVLSSRAIAAEEAIALWQLLGPPHERQRRDFRRLTDVVLIENGATIYWPRTGELSRLPAPPTRWLASRRPCHDRCGSQARAGLDPWGAAVSHAGGSPS